MDQPDSVHSPSIITLLTDFGYRDEYVGVMKGVALAHCRNAQLIDLSHEVPPQDILFASRLLAHSHHFFPPGTIHLAVVDPGVGSERNILLVEYNQMVFIAPDNGLLTPIFQSDGIKRCFAVDAAETAAATMSSTFHGRDIMAPLAGKIAAGLSPAAVGREQPVSACVLLPTPAPQREGNRIACEVISIDHFGNLATAVSRAMLHSMSGTAVVHVKGRRIEGIRTTYADVKQGELLAYIDSRGFVEVGINCGSAADELGCESGEKIIIEFS